MLDATAKGNRNKPQQPQQAGFFFHDRSSILPFSNTEIVLFVFQSLCITNMKDILLKSGQKR